MKLHKLMMEVNKMICKFCGNYQGRAVGKIVIGMFRKPQEVFSIFCVNCGNLMYGYCRNVKPLEEPVKV